MNVSELIKNLQTTPDMDADAFVGGADVVAATGDFTGGGEEDEFDATAHGLSDDQEVVLLYKAAAGVLTGISVGDHVFVDLIDANSFGLASSAGGTRIENSADGDIVVAPAIATVSLTNAESTTPAADGPEASNATPDPGWVEIG